MIKDIRNIEAHQCLIFLVHIKDAPFLFETVGRPDTGIKISEEFMFSDWLMGTPSLIRLHSADAAQSFQELSA